MSSGGEGDGGGRERKVDEKEGEGRGRKEDRKRKGKKEVVIAEEVKGKKVNKNSRKKNKIIQMLTKILRLNN